MNKYITVKCPVCHSVSQLKSHGVRTEIFYCPVCEEGEITYKPESPRSLYKELRLSPALQKMVPIYVAAK